MPHKLVDKFIKSDRGDRNSGGRGTIAPFQTDSGGNKRGISNSGDKKKHGSSGNDINNRVANDGINRGDHDSGSHGDINDRPSPR